MYIPVILSNSFDILAVNHRSSVSSLGSQRNATLLALARQYSLQSLLSVIFTGSHLSVPKLSIAGILVCTLLTLCIKTHGTSCIHVSF